MMQLTKASTSDVVVINSISKRAFDSDIIVGASSKGDPIRNLTRLMDQQQQIVLGVPTGHTKTIA